MILRSLKTGGSERVTLILENGEEIASTLGVVTELRLYAGKDLTDAELKLLLEKTAAAAARNHALLLLSQRPHSQKELYDKLVRKGERTDAAEAAVHLFHFADVEFVHTGVRWLPPPSGTYQAQGLFQGNNRCRRCYCPMIVIKGYRIPNTHFEQKTNFIPLDVHIYIG